MPEPGSDGAVMVAMRSQPTTARSKDSLSEISFQSKFFSVLMRRSPFLTEGHFLLKTAQQQHFKPCNFCFSPN